MHLFRRTLITLTTLVVMFAIAITPALAITDAPTPPSGIVYANTGTFGASYTFMTRYQSNAAQSILKVGVMRGGVGDTEGYTLLIWGPAATSVPTATHTAPGTSAKGMQWVDVSGDGITLSNGSTFYIGVDQSSGYNGVYFEAFPTGGQNFGGVSTLSSWSHVGYSHNLTDSGWSTSSNWYNILVEVG